MEQSGPVVFVFARDGEVMAFPHLETAAGWMEAIDVLEGEYSGAFTIDGRKVTISAEPDSPVSLRVTHVGALAELGERLGRSSALIGRRFDLSDLTAVANYLMLMEWNHRWPRRPRWLSRLIHGNGPARV